MVSFLDIGDIVGVKNFHWQNSRWSLDNTIRWASIGIVVDKRIIHYTMEDIVEYKIEWFYRMASLSGQESPCWYSLYARDFCSERGSWEKLT